MSNQRTTPLDQSHPDPVIQRLLDWLKTSIAGLFTRLTTAEDDIDDLQTQLGAHRIVAGTVNSNGLTWTGTGFTITKGATGIYSIVFSTAFSATPHVVVTPVTNLDRAGAQLSTGTRSGSQIDVFLFDTTAATNADTTFAFVAVGT